MTIADNRPSCQPFAEDSVLLDTSITASISRSVAKTKRDGIFSLSIISRDIVTMEPSEEAKKAGAIPSDL